MKAKILVLAVSLFALLLAIPASTAQAQTWQHTALGDSLAAGTRNAERGMKALNKVSAFIPRSAFRVHRYFSAVSS